MANYRQSLNDAGTDARPSPLCQFVMGLCFLLLHLQYAIFLPFQDPPTKRLHLVFLEQLLLQSVRFSVGVQDPSLV